LHAFVATWCAALLSAALATPSLPQSQAPDLRTRFEHEANPVQKAKLMPALGDAEFAEIRKDAEANNLTEAASVLRRYRDDVRNCVKGLEGAKLNAEKHPAGFKQLQFSVQEALRRVDTLLPAMTSDEQAPFLEVRKDLDETNRHLIDQLFPGKSPEQPQPAQLKER